MNWQPIATAPRDGTEFQAWVEYSTGEGEWFPRAKFHTDQRIEGYFEVYRYIQSYHEEDFKQEDGITHWMPQPSKPEIRVRHGWKGHGPLCGDESAVRPSDQEFRDSDSTDPICKACQAIMDARTVIYVGTENKTRQGVARAEDETL